MPRKSKVEEEPEDDVEDDESDPGRNIRQYKNVEVGISSVN